jgi:hypothetical protein
MVIQNVPLIWRVLWQPLVPTMLRDGQLPIQYKLHEQYELALNERVSPS